MGRSAIIKWGGNSPINWSGQTAIIVASGPSAAATDFGLLRGQRVIAVNRSWQLYPDAEILYATDGHFMHFYHGIPEFKGCKITSSPSAAQSFGIACLFCDGNNSGLRTIYLAEALGAKCILLIGFDMHINDTAHWHEPYPKGQLHNPTDHNARLWRGEFDRSKHKICKRIEVINCTPESALTCFTKIELKEALNAIKAIGSCDLL